jgi:RNA-directed DNA polymerase
MAVERRGPAVGNDSNKKEGKGDMTKTPISLQDLRRSLYIKANAEPAWRFWGLYVHICKMETLHEAYGMAKKNDGAPGIGGVTFEAIEESGEESFLQQIQRRTGLKYVSAHASTEEGDTEGRGTKVRILSIPSIRDRVVQGALKLILEPIFEADFQSGSYGYRPKRTAHEAVYQVAKAIDQEKTRVIDLDLRAYFDNVQHSLLLEKVARRVQDDDVMRLLKMILKATGKKGVPQGGVVSPLLSNLYLNEVDRMLEKAIQTTRRERYTHVQYARFADDLVILIDSHAQHDWLVRAVEQRLREELAKLKVEINEEKSKIVDLANGGSFTFLGFEYRRILGRNRKWRPYYAPKLKKRTALLAKLKEIFRQSVSQPVEGVVEQINPILRGWVHYFAVGDSSECFSFVRDWVEKKIRGHLMRARERSGHGWKRWSRQGLYGKLGLYDDYRLRRPWSLPKVQPAQLVT